MLLLFFVHFLSTRALPIQAANDENVSESCNDVNNCRTLLGIIWSCLTTVFLCTWVVIHPNIAKQVDLKDANLLQSCQHKVSQFFRDKLPLFLFTLFIPEYVLAWAICQRLMARKISKEYAKFGVTQTHGFFMIMGGFHYFSDTGENYPLTWKDVGELLEKQEITLPTEAEIQDKSKSDRIAKTLVLIQTLWFVMQCIARRLERLPTTELEIVTLAYGAISFGMFIAWWDKPCNVECPIRVSQKPTKGNDDHWGSWWERLFHAIIGWQDRHGNLHYKQKVPMFYSGRPGRTEILIADTITLAAGVVFGAIHCIAWSFHFPSHAESLLWRISSAAITTVPVIIFIASVVVFGWNIEAMVYPLVLLLGVSGLLYVAARVITVVLAFVTLASLPLGAFQTVHWTTLIPHV